MKKVNVYMFRKKLAKYLVQVEKTGDLLLVYKYKQAVSKNFSA
ncbi:MAG: hypothetical protein KatS3mg092_0383 [Patescibacteria group bacterium]|nr:MAG: hypothetical protein KatS3mg092_0383 [Patescibacteria group bacterium]